MTNFAVMHALPRIAEMAPQSGFAVDEVAVRARSNGKGPRHVIWLATRP